MISIQKILAWIAGLSAVVAGVFLAGRKTAKDELTLKSAEQSVKDLRKANDIDSKVHALSDADLNRELHNPPK